jgi:NitT/TauT family transport system permease protein
VTRARTFSRPLVVTRTWPLLVDVVVLASAVGLVYGLSFVASRWFSAPVPQADIDRSPTALPVYAFYSLVRIAAAYLLSLLFALAYGYVAAHEKRAEGLMIAVLDILQSIPVLSFLPGVMLAMVALFPTRQLGLELGSIVLIFTGQVWNMAFSFYSSLKAIPRELWEATRVFRFSRWQRFVQLELPYGAIGLVWNSMVSVAGGWFFLMACEMFQLNRRDFRLPGLGSYLQTAASHGDTRAMLWGLAVMVGVIVALDQLVWRPVIVWSERFKFEQVETGQTPRSPILALLTRSRALAALRRQVLAPLSERLALHAARWRNEAAVPKPASRLPRAVGWLAASAVTALALYASTRAGLVLWDIPAAEYGATLRSALATFLRVLLSLLIATLWAVPAGVAIGSHPRLARIAQPIAQVAASVPATALFPIILLAIIRVGGGIGAGSIVLMLLGTQWYILFNVIAGVLAIPTDLREVSDAFRFPSRERWTTVILPGIFPHLLTGLVTASGGAWNASIVAEYFRLRDTTYSTTGLGAQISRATDTGNFAQLLLSTLVMAAMVVTVNRLVWKPLFRLSERRYRLG